MGLLETYELMKQAELEEQPAIEEEKIAEERMELIAKYAEFADNALAEEFGTDYTEEDVEKLAEMLIMRDLEISEEQEKVAEITDAAKVFAHAFAEELQNIAEETKE